MNPRNKFNEIRERSTFAAKGAFLGAMIGGVFGRKPASAGAAFGASLGVLLSDKKKSLTTRRERVKEQVVSEPEEVVEQAVEATD